MAATGRAYIKTLLRDYPVFHWLCNVDEVHYMQFMEVVRQEIEQNGWPRKVVLHVNSSGGDLDVACAFYDYIRLSGLHLVTVASGVVESAAVMLFLAGKERYASQFSSFLLHNPIIEMHHAELSEDNIEQTRLHVLTMRDRWLEILSRELGVIKEEIRKISKDALPLTAERAKELGIVHHIV